MGMNLIAFRSNSLNILQFLESLSWSLLVFDVVYFSLKIIKYCLVNIPWTWSENSFNNWATSPNEIALLYQISAVVSKGIRFPGVCSSPISCIVLTGADSIWGSLIFLVAFQRKWKESLVGVGSSKYFWILWVFSFK